MPRPVPTQLFHFTHVNNLPSIINDGLVSDTAAHSAGSLAMEVGNLDIKQARRRRPVPIDPGGQVADYVPFYFAPRSPMMFAIASGNVATYAGGCDALVYLVTTVERLVELGLHIVFTDRNAALAAASFAADTDDLDFHIDWPLMRARMWNNTPEEPDRMERRMAECLVGERVPWHAFTEIVAQNVTTARTAIEVLATVDVSPPVVVRPGWYY